MILVLRALGLGDLLTVVPALRALRAAFPGEEIALAAPGVLAPLVSRIEAVDRLVVVDSAVNRPPLTPPVPGGPVRLAVNLHGRGPESTTVLRALGPAELWAYDLGGAPAWRVEDHDVTRWCRLVAGYGCPADPADLLLGENPGHDGPVLIHPGAAAPERRWPVARFATVARHLSARGAEVVLTGTAEERPIAVAVAESAGLRPGAVLAGTTDLGSLADLVSTAGLVICGDTGMSHLATAYRTPSVVLLGPQPPERWGPPLSEPRHVGIWHGSVPVGEPGQVHPSLLRISVDDVITAAESVRAGCLF